MLTSNQDEDRLRPKQELALLRAEPQRAQVDRTDAGRVIVPLPITAAYLRLTMPGLGAGASVPVDLNGLPIISQRDSLI